MPTYEYKCTQCGHQLEEFQKISDKPLTTCPQCHQESLSKLLSAAGFQLKGSGWYVTDYSKKSKKDTGGSKTEASDRGENKSADKQKESSTSGKKEDNSSSNSGAAT